MNFITQFKHFTFSRELMFGVKVCSNQKNLVRWSRRQSAIDFLLVRELFEQILIFKIEIIFFANFIKLISSLLNPRPPCASSSERTREMTERYLGAACV